MGITSRLAAAVAVGGLTLGALGIGAAVASAQPPQAPAQNGRQCAPPPNGHQGPPPSGHQGPPPGGQKPGNPPACPPAH